MDAKGLYDGIGRLLTNSTSRGLPKPVGDENKDKSENSITENGGIPVVENGVAPVVEQTNETNADEKEQKVKKIDEREQNVDKIDERESKSPIFQTEERQSDV